MSAEAKQADYVGLAADIVSAYVTKNSVTRAELPALIQSVHLALNNTAHRPTEVPPEELHPAVPIKKSITPDYLVCLEDGEEFKSLKRHLRTTRYNMTPEQYRSRWGLPSDYPMTAPNYALRRSALAKSMELGRKREPDRRRSRNTV